MDGITDSAVMTALGRQMTRAVEKQAVAAGNLANLDTPGFRAREASFDTALDGALGRLELATTNPGQIPGLPSESTPTREVAGLQSRRDGNNVQLDRELLAMTRASGDFAAAQAALSAKFRLIRFAINEGR
jgi:flagellar basal-body rod protein FlgB